MKMHTSDTHLVSRDDVLALLEDGPKETGALATWLSHPQARVIAACTEMVHAKQIKRLPHPDRRWALPGYDLDAATIARIERVQTAVKAPLRQPDERLTVIPVKKETPPSWWVWKSRPDFTAAAREQLEQMRKSTIGKKLYSGVND